MGSGETCGSRNPGSDNTHPNEEKMKMTYALVSLEFLRGRQEKLILTANAVLAHLPEQEVMADPPVKMVDLQAAITAVTAAEAAMVQGGTAATVIKDQKRADQAKLLEELAEFVNQKALGDRAVLLATGFNARRDTRTKSPLPAPQMRGLANGEAGELLATVTRVDRAGSYEAQTAEIGPDGMPLEWVTRAVVTASRNIPLRGLTSGKTYLVRVRAIGGSTGASPWSESMSRMSL